MEWPVSILEGLVSGMDSISALNWSVSCFKLSVSDLEWSISDLKWSVSGLGWSASVLEWSVSGLELMTVARNLCFLMLARLAIDDSYKDSILPDVCKA